MTFKLDGYGYEWDAELVGGPADGCLDRVIQVGGDKTPPKFFKKMLNEEPKRETLGEKLIEHWASRHIEDEMKIAVYELDCDPEDVDEDSDTCVYRYLETINMGIARKKYGFM